MLRLALASMLLGVAAPPLAAATDGAQRSIVASCADASVVFAAKWDDVHCAGAIQMPPGHVPRVGSTRDRAGAVRFEREAARERSLEDQIARRLHPRAFLASHGSRMTVFAEGVPWLEAWLARALGPDGPPTGPALVFRLESPAGAPGLPVPSFAQGGRTHRPEPGDAGQMGWIRDEGAGPGSRRSHVGYVILPPGFDLKRPLVIFWGDSVAATRPWRGSRVVEAPLGGFGGEPDSRIEGR